MIGLPENLKWHIREYLQDKIPLILDDVPRNSRKKSDLQNKAAGNGTAPEEVKQEDEVKEEKKTEEQVKKEKEEECEYSVSKGKFKFQVHLPSLSPAHLDR